jgi:hypothetical protein
MHDAVQSLCSFELFSNHAISGKVAEAGGNDQVL